MVYFTFFATGVFTGTIICLLVLFIWAKKLQKKQQKKYNGSKKAVFIPNKK